MNTRSTRFMVAFANPFSLPGSGGALPAGSYEVVIEEELIQGLSFEAWRRTATYLTVRGRSSQAGRTELRVISSAELEEALGRDAALARPDDQSDAAHSPREDLK